LVFVIKSPSPGSAALGECSLIVEDRCARTVQGFLSIDYADYINESA